MKKHFLIVMLSFLAVGLCSCGEGFSTDFDESLLYGKWQEGSVYERYYASDIDFELPNGNTVQVNGVTWDEADDVDEDEGQPFNWTLTGSTLKQIHEGTFVSVPKVYTVTSLTSSSLTYEDAYGTKHQFSKVN